MSLLQTNLAPDEVFTPRTANVNEKMYIERKALEQAFGDRLLRGSHLVIFGESGCGKSWLYKRFFSLHGVFYEIANLANASRNSSIAHELAHISRGEATSRLAGYSESKSAEVGIEFVGKFGGQLQHQKQFDVVEPDPFYAALKEIRARAADKKAFLVLDNLERIFDKPKLMDELADLITLLDDGRYSQFDVRLLIVGVPSGVREYFSKTPTRTTVANRLAEIPEVSRLSREESERLILQGFVTELKYEWIDEHRPTILNHIIWVTDSIPQKLHEYCLELALIGYPLRRLDPSMLERADRQWLESSLSSAYTAVEMLMNERDTKIGRRNQVIFCLGQMERDEFRYSDIETKVRAEFPDSTAGTGSLNIPQLLSELAAPDAGILKRAPKGDSYMLRDPVYRMCIRTMLKRVPGSDKIERIQIARV